MMEAMDNYNNEAFVDLSVQDASDYGENFMQNPHTRRKTLSDMKIFTDWLRSEDESRLPEDIPVDNLDQYLARFFQSVMTKKNEEYEPDTLKSIQSSINRYLLDKSEINILKDKEFQHSRDALNAKRKELKGKGLDKKHKADPLTTEEIEILYQKELLGTTNSEALLNTVWLNNSLHFGMRGRREHTNLLWGDVELKATSSGLQYLEYNEFKSRKGEKSKKLFAPKMFAVPDDPKCPVKSFLKYKQHLDDKCYRLFQRPKRNCTKHSLKWYDSIPLGHNTISSMMPAISEKAGLSTRYTNHSLRATVARILDSTGKVANRHVRNVSEQQEDSMTSNSYTGPGMERKNSDTISHILRSADVDSVSKNNCQDHDHLCTSSGDGDASLGDSRCPVNTFKAFARRRPPDTLQPDSRFYLSPLSPQNQDHTTGIWYTRQPLGKNRLGYIMKTMTEKGELSGRKVCPVSLSCTQGKASTVDVCQTIQGTESELSSIVQHTPVQQTQTSGFSSHQSCDNAGAQQYRSILIRPSENVTSTFESVGHVEPEPSNDTEKNTVVDKPPQKNDTLETVYESPDHQKQILNKLYELWKEDKLCDAALSIGSEKVQVHKAVLMANCPYVLNLCLKQNKDPVMDVKLPPYISLDGLKVIVQYFYLGILKLTAGNVLSVEKIAKYLEMKDIYSFCRGFRSKLMSSYTSDSDSSDSDCEDPLPAKTNKSPATVTRKRKYTTVESNSPMQVSGNLVDPVSSRVTSHPKDMSSYEIMFSSDRSKMFCVARDGASTESATDKSLMLPLRDISENCSSFSIKQEPVDDSYHYSNESFVHKSKNLETNRETIEVGGNSNNTYLSVDDVGSSKHGSAEMSNSNKNDDCNNGVCSLEMEVQCKQEPEDCEIDYERPGKCVNSSALPTLCGNTVPVTSSVVATGANSSQVTNMVYVVQSQPAMQTDPKQFILAGPVPGNSSVVLTPVINTPQVRQTYRKAEAAPKPILPNLPAPTGNKMPSDVPYPVQVIPNIGSIQQSTISNSSSFIPKQT